MPSLQNLDSSQIGRIVKDAVERRIPATLTIRRDKGWLTLHAQFLACQRGQLLLELPAGPKSSPPPLKSAEKIGLTFKLKHHKHICQVTVTDARRVRFDDGRELPVLSLPVPAQMQRLQRRAFQRVEVPANRVVRASFWLGAHQDEPAGAGGERLVWIGRVINFSAGGCRLLAEASAGDVLEIGDAVGLRLSFAVGQQAVYADAQLRHIETDADKALLGFQFLGLDQTAAGQRTMDILAAKVVEYQRAGEQTSRRRPAS